MLPTVACDASSRTLCNVADSQCHNWLRRPARPDRRLGNKTHTNDDAPPVGELHVRVTNGRSPTTANAAANPQVNSTNPPTPTPATQDSSPTTTSSGIIPAVIAVVIFVVCVFVVLRILRAIRLNRLVAACTADSPETPRMWEARLDNTTHSSFAGKWSEIMPLAAQRSTQCDTGSRPPLVREMSVSTDASGSQTRGHNSGNSSSCLPPLTLGKSAVAATEEGYVLPGHVAVLITMPTPSKHAFAHGEQPKIVGPISIGVVDM